MESAEAKADAMALPIWLGVYIVSKRRVLAILYVRRPYVGAGDVDVGGVTNGIGFCFKLSINAFTRCAIWETVGCQRAQSLGPAVWQSV